MVEVRGVKEELSNVLSYIGCCPTSIKEDNGSVYAEFDITNRPFHAHIHLMIESSRKASVSVISPVDVGMTGYSRFQTFCFIKNILSYLKCKKTISKEWYCFDTPLGMRLNFTSEFSYENIDDLVEGIEIPLYECEVAMKHICSRFLRL